MSTVPTDKKLKRYYMFVGGGYGCPTAEAEIYPDGEWVRYDDHEAAVRELAEQLEEALTHLSQMFEGFDFESGLGKPEAADAENAWNFLLSHTNVRTSPTDPTPPEK